MTDYMIERVARAICRAGICGPKEHLDEQENANWRRFTIEARAAIESLRYPSKAMLEAAESPITYNSRFEGVNPYPSEVWDRMIDAALKLNPLPA